MESTLAHPFEGRPGTHFRAAAAVAPPDRSLTEPGPTLGGRKPHTPCCSSGVLIELVMTTLPDAGSFPWMPRRRLGMKNTLAPERPQMLRELRNGLFFGLSGREQPV
jgi:hypothetical protein